MRWVRKAKCGRGGGGGGGSKVSVIEIRISKPKRTLFEHGVFGAGALKKVDRATWDLQRSLFPFFPPLPFISGCLFEYINSSWNGHRLTLITD